MFNCIAVKINQLIILNTNLIYVIKYMYHKDTKLYSVLVVDIKTENLQHVFLYPVIYIYENYFLISIKSSSEVYEYILHTTAKMTNEGNILHVPNVLNSDRLIL